MRQSNCSIIYLKKLIIRDGTYLDSGKQGEFGINQPWLYNLVENFQLCWIVFGRLSACFSLLVQALYDTVPYGKEKE